MTLEERDLTEKCAFLNSANQIIKEYERNPLNLINDLVQTDEANRYNFIHGIVKDFDVSDPNSPVIKIGGFRYKPGGGTEPDDIFDGINVNVQKTHENLPYIHKNGDILVVLAPPYKSYFGELCCNCKDILCDFDGYVDRNGSIHGYMEMMDFIQGQTEGPTKKKQEKIEENVTEQKRLLKDCLPDIDNKYSEAKANTLKTEKQYNEAEQALGTSFLSYRFFSKMGGVFACAFLCGIITAVGSFAAWVLLGLFSKLNDNLSAILNFTVGLGIAATVCGVALMIVSTSVTANIYKKMLPLNKLKQNTSTKRRKQKKSN